MQGDRTWGARVPGIDAPAAASPTHSLGGRSGWYLVAEPARLLGDSTAVPRPYMEYSLSHPWAPPVASQQQPRAVPWYNRPLEDFSAPRAAGAATALPTLPNDYLRLEPAAAHCVHNDATAGAVPSAALQHDAEDRPAAPGAAQPAEVPEDEVICISDDDEPLASTAPLDERPFEREPASRGHNGLALPADAGAHSGDEEEADDDAPPRSGGRYSRYFGVSKYPRCKTKKYRAQVRHNGKRYEGGMHSSPQEAAHTYDALVREHKLPNPLNFTNDAGPAAPVLPVRTAPPRSGYFGVHMSGRAYKVETEHLGKRYYGGRYTSPQEAARAYDALVREHKLPKPLNFPTDAEPAAAERIVEEEEEEPQGQVDSAGAVRGRYPKRKRKSFASEACTQDGVLMPPATPPATTLMTSILRRARLRNARGTPLVRRPPLRPALPQSPSRQRQSSLPQSSRRLRLRLAPSLRAWRPSSAASH